MLPGGAINRAGIVVETARVRFALNLPNLPGEGERPGIHHDVWVMILLQPALGSISMSIRELKARLTAEEHKLLESLRERKPARNPPSKGDLRFGERLADAVASNVGSWTFIVIQSLLLFLWIIANSVAWFMSWDPYPFILLNLVLSFQAAFTAPIIMMSQNRQSTIDRRNAQHDYDVNTKAELEIELLHQKVDLMREQELTVLLQMVKRLEERLMLAENGGKSNGEPNSSET